LAALGKWYERLDAFDPLPSMEMDEEPCDARGHEETWADMMRLQNEGIYPTAFRAVRSPVLMLHGAEDPHPGARIRASLLPYLPQLEYQEFPRCGHTPWHEKAACEEFFSVLSRWLLSQCFKATP